VDARCARSDWPCVAPARHPRTASISAVSAHAILHTYLGGPPGWPGRTRALDDAQQDRLRRQAPVVDGAAGHVELTPDEQRMLAVLAAITGTHNLVAQVLTSGPAALHRYLTGPLAELAAIRVSETTPVLQTLKAL
jgi:hypothetical protein